MLYQTDNINSTKKMVFIAILLAQGIILSFFERFIPLSFAVPGAKLGLCNIIVLTSIYLLSFKEALLLVFLRSFLSALLFSGFSGFLYSISGGLLSFFVMYFVKNNFKNSFSIVGNSILGGVFHNIGQIFMAAFIIQNIKITVYLPMLFLMGLLTGIFVGFCTNFLLESIKKLGIIDL